MPLRRCLDCQTLVRTGNRCSPCAKRRKSVRNAHAAALGKCPQTGRCWICGRPARDNDPLTWDHVIPISDPESTPFARPAHRTCNSGRRDRW